MAGHSHRTLMEELGTLPVLADERMGHTDGSVQRRYTHVTADMRARLVEDLTQCWEAALDARFAMSPGSPVAVVDKLLQARAKKKNGGDPKIVAQSSPTRGFRSATGEGPGQDFLDEPFGVSKDPQMDTAGVPATRNETNMGSVVVP